MRSQGNSNISTYKGDLDNPITRKDAIRNLLYSFGVRNVVGSKYYKNIPFLDMPISTVFNYDGYILIANRLGIVYGDLNGNINPNNYLSRAEAISIINRAIKVENWEIPVPDIINGLKIEYRGDGTQGFIENICSAISKYPEAVVNKFSEDGWKIVITDEDYRNYYDSLKKVGGLYSQEEKILYIFTHGKKPSLFFTLSKSIAHEFAHYMHIEFIEEEDREQIKLSFHDDNLVDELAKLTKSDYCRTDEYEFFAEYISYVIMTYDEKIHNIENFKNIQNIFDKY